MLAADACARPALAAKRAASHKFAWTWTWTVPGRCEDMPAGACCCTAGAVCPLVSVQLAWSAVLL